MKYEAIYRVDIDNVLFLRLGGGLRNMCFITHMQCFITYIIVSGKEEKKKLRRGKWKGREETDNIYV